MGERQAGGTSRPTWHDWMPPGAPEPELLLTRNELIDRLRRDGIEIHVNALRYWEQEGVIPHPVRRWHEGATRALYPTWYRYLIRKVLELRRRGYLLPQVSPRVRAYAEHSLGTRTDVLTDAVWEEDIETGELIHLGPPFWGTVEGPEDLDPPAGLGPALHELADLHARYTGVATRRIEVHIVDVDNGETRYVFPVRAPEG